MLGTVEGKFLWGTQESQVVQSPQIPKSYKFFLLTFHNYPSEECHHIHALSILKVSFPDPPPMRSGNDTRKPVNEFLSGLTGVPLCDDRGRSRRFLS